MQIGVQDMECHDHGEYLGEPEQEEHYLNECREKLES